jgi:hypothetical protein
LHELVQAVVAEEVDISERYAVQENVYSGNMVKALVEEGSRVSIGELAALVVEGGLLALVDWMPLRWPLIWRRLLVEPGGS